MLTAVVTGGSSGIGWSICEHLLGAGYRVISLALQNAPDEHECLESVCVDLTDARAAREAAEEIAARHQVTSIVNNAGALQDVPIEDVEVEDLERLTALHLGSAIQLTQAFLPAMKAARFGRIVNMSSRAVVGLSGRTVYGATKAALVSMTRTWAVELGPAGITVNAIAPGPIVTEMLTKVIPEDSEQAQALARQLPRKRLGTPADVARAAMFFLDPENDWVTGQTLFVCGGASVGSLQL